MSYLPQSLSLDDAIMTAIERDPTLIALRAQEPVAHAAYHVAETYPFNPQFQTEILPCTHVRSGNDAPVSQQYAIVQTFELTHQRRYRTEAATASWRQVGDSIRAAELVSVARTARLYFAALYQRALRDQAQSLATLNQQLVGVLQRRFEAGQAAATDITLASLESQSLLLQAELAESNYQSSSPLA